MGLIHMSTRLDPYHKLAIVIFPKRYVLLYVLEILGDQSLLLAGQAPSRQ